MIVNIQKKKLNLKVVNGFFLITLITFSLFPVIPGNIKGLPVVFLAVTTLMCLLTGKNALKKTISLKYILLYSLLFLLYLFSLIYSKNISYGFKKIETTFSMFLIPFCFAIIFNYVKLSLLEINLFKYIYVLSTTIYATAILFYLNYLGYEYCLNNMSPCLSYIDSMFFLKEHPIYVSMFIAIAIIFIINNFTKQKTLIKFIYVLCLTINVYVLIFLIRKGVIIALGISALVFLFNIKKFKMINYKLVFVLLVVFSILTISFRDALISRFSELGTLISYEKINEGNSTSIRFGIYKCAILLIEKNILFGYGIGDVPDILVSCYKHKSDILVKNRYNSHNQYLGILLSVGIIGVLVFITQLFVYLKKAILNNDILFIQILLFYTTLFLTENILDRQSGVILFTFLVNYLYFFSSSNIVKI